MTEPPRRSQDLKENESRRSKDKFYEILEGHFFGILIGIACIGIGLAFTAPLWFYLFNALYNSLFLFKLFNIDISAGDSVSALRQAILTATGGALAIFTLLETHQKNIREKEKNEQDHIRQVHAERRSRYAKAVEQLADEKAPIRLGGVYTLFKLIDEWLADEKTLPSEEERREEGQVIIKSLCAYIRSPFDLASKAEELSENKAPENYEGGDQQFVKNQARFREEEELQLTILDAIKTRLNGGTITQEDGTKKPLKGLWSDFDYDFSNARFFYPIDFASSYFGASSKFSGATFTKRADFSGAEFIGFADFSEAKFTKDAHFSEIEFIGFADFSRAEFTGITNFFEAKFTGNAYFSEAKFTKDAHFSRAEFTGNAYFSEAKFTGNAYFSEAKFTKNAHFFRAEFTGITNFIRTKFTGNANFVWTIFTQNPGFFGARFSCKVNPESYNFNVSSNSRQITPEYPQPEYNGIKFTIPKGATLFDPDDLSEQEDNGDS